MKQISTAVDGILAPKQPLDDEYRNEADGLIYCAKCHTPRQHRVQLNDRVLLPMVRCRCQQEAYEKEEAERKHQEFLMQVSRLKANGLQDKSLRDYTFANDKGYNPEIRKAHDYVAHWEEMKEKSLGLLLWGDVGTGKSFFAGCIANALLEKGIPVLMTNFSRILNTLTGMYSDDRNRFIDSLNKYSLLIIDDLGIERGTEFSLEQVFNVIDSRYRSKKPMIVTTNLTLNELKHPVDLAHARIYDRILERCVPLKINNQNIRELNAAANM
ncbi:ATP-binding protein [Oscillospiraceae bacterium HCP3S3_F4]